MGLLALELALGSLDDTGLKGVLRRALHLVEDAKTTRKILPGHGIRRRTAFTPDFCSV